MKGKVKHEGSVSRLEYDFLHIIINKDKIAFRSLTKKDDFYITIEELKGFIDKHEKQELVTIECDECDKEITVPRSELEKAPICDCSYCSTHSECTLCYGVICHRFNEPCIIIGDKFICNTCEQEIINKRKEYNSRKSSL